MSPKWIILCRMGRNSIINIHFVNIFGTGVRQAGIRTDEAIGSFQCFETDSRWHEGHPDCKKTRPTHAEGEPRGFADTVLLGQTATERKY